MIKPVIGYMVLNAFRTVKFSALQMIKHVTMLPTIYSKFILLGCFDKIVSIVNATRPSSATKLFGYKSF